MSDAEIIPQLLFSVDTRDFAAARATLAERVYHDWTSLTGGEPEVLDADALVAQWRSSLPGFEATTHLVSLMAMRGDEAVGAMQAHHWITGAPGGDLWWVRGHYVATITDGLISAFTLRVARQGGNLDLPAIAAERAAALAHA